MLIFKINENKIFDVTYVADEYRVFPYIFEQDYKTYDRYLEVKNRCTNFCYMDWTMNEKTSVFVSNNIKYIVILIKPRHNTKYIELNILMSYSIQPTVYYHNVEPIYETSKGDFSIFKSYIWLTSEIKYVKIKKRKYEIDLADIIIKAK